MNIRTITNPLTAVDSVKTNEVRDVKTEVSSEDRDPNGRREQDEPDKNPLTKEELEKVEEYIRQLPGFQANGLTYEVETGGEFKIFVIQDKDGLVVRRIVEWELRQLLQDKDKKTGQIFDRSA
jgi:hypothetical protein